jgi:hypothetical protein
MPKSVIGMPKAAVNSGSLSGSGKPSFELGAI